MRSRGITRRKKPRRPFSPSGSYRKAPKAQVAKGKLGWFERLGEPEPMTGYVVGQVQIKGIENARKIVDNVRNHRFGAAQAVARLIGARIRPGKTPEERYREVIDIAAKLELATKLVKP